MGYYAEYLEMGLDFEGLTRLRKEQLQKIGLIRGRPTLVFASDLNKGHAPISINYDDLIPLYDQIANLPANTELDFIIETPGGDGTIAESIVSSLHDKFSEIGIIIPGSAMSAGAIMAMSGDEILMHPIQSAVGPIDAQLIQNGKQFSAHAFLEGIENIKKEATDTGALNRAYIPILQNISPGEIEHAKNAQEFSQQLVRDWLVKYKFRNWNVHSTSGNPVTDQEKIQRAEEIAAALCDHGKWKTHGRRIRLADLHELRLRITDYSKDRPDLCEAIQRYFVLLQLTFNQSGVYKIYETTNSQILKHYSTGQVSAPPPVAGPFADIQVPCPCGAVSMVRAMLDEDQQLPADKYPYPVDDIFTCPSCSKKHNLSGARLGMEAQTRKKVIK